MGLAKTLSERHLGAGLDYRSIQELREIGSITRYFTIRERVVLNSGDRHLIEAMTGHWVRDDRYLIAGGAYVLNHNPTTGEQLDTSHVLLPCVQLHGSGVEIVTLELNEKEIAAALGNPEFLE